MTDEQLSQRFAQIAQAFEHVLAITEKHSEQIGHLVAVTAKLSEEMTRISREWGAYLRTIRPQ
jgi:hypothetical protein